MVSERLKTFFKGLTDLPKFKQKHRSDVKMYFVKNNPTDCTVERHRMKIPTLKWVRLKEKGYIPTTKDGFVVSSGTVSTYAGRYYVTCVVKLPDPSFWELNDFGIGIDLGIAQFATISTGIVYQNINYSDKVKKLEKRLKREQRKLSRKQLAYRKQKKGGATRKNLDKQLLKVQKLYKRLRNIRTDYINKVINELVRTKPAYIALEDLNVSGMLKNRHLAKAIASQRFYEFRAKLEAKCKVYGIEFRLMDRFCPSSKTCHQCGQVNKDLKLSDRVYICDCGYTNDRDHNASLNLRDTEQYEVLK